MRKLTYAFIIFLLMIVNYSSGQERVVERFSEKFKSYRTFSEFDAFVSIGMGDYKLTRGGVTFSLGKQITDEYSCSVFLGLDWYPKYDEERPLMYSNMLLPAGINVKRYFVSNPRIIPHLSLDLGSTIPFGDYGFFAVPAVGLGIGNLKFQLGCSFQSYQHEESPKREVVTAVQAKVGFFF